MRTLFKAGMLIITVAWFGNAMAWDPDEADKMERVVKEAVSTLLEKDPGMQRFFDKSAGYVVLPSVGKGGMGVGGARGRGLLYEGGSPTAVVTMTQLTIGFQLGGQAFSEFIFFKDDVALAEFKRGSFEFGAQVSAVAVTAGVSADADYSKGVAVFTQTKGGLMYEASVGGQKFSLEPR